MPLGMNRSTSLLQRHLLTRSDLANLEVPATEVFRWLAEGKLEQVGELPVGDDKDPVFTVLSDSLRRELDERLATIDKPTVVMTPLGVRSFLLRALLHERDPLSRGDEQVLDATNTTEVEAEQARLVTTDELGDVLQDLAVHRLDDVQTVLQLAAEIAATEAVVAEQIAHQPEDEAMNNDPEPEELFEDTPPAAEAEVEEPAAPAPAPFVQIERDIEDVDEPAEAPEDAPEETEVEEGFVAIELPESNDEQEVAEIVEEPSDDQVEAEGEDEQPDVAVEEPDADAPEPQPAEQSFVTIEVPASDDEQEVAEPEAPVAEVADEPEVIVEEPAAEIVEETPDDEVEAQAEVEPPAEELEEPDVVAATAEATTEEPVAATAEEPQDFALTNATMDRVQDFLGELKSALVEMAQRPAPAPEPAPAAEPAPVDVTPLVEAMQQGFERSASQATETTTALASLAQRMGEFGERVETGLTNGVRSMQSPHADTSGPVMAMAAPQTEFVASGGNRQALVLSAVAVLVVCWSILFWVKTGSPRLALGTLVGANAIGCCMLLARRNRS